MKSRTMMIALVALAAAVAGVLASASGASQPGPSATARPAGASGNTTQANTFAPPAACNPCLYYSGDFNAADPNANALANENDATVNGAEVWTPVRPDKNWLVTGLFVNTLASTGSVDSTTPWKIRTGMSSGNGGSLYASGTGAASYTATGRSAFGYTEYTLFVPVSPTVLLHPGVKYWVNVQPQCSGCAVRYFESNVEPAGSGANRVGPADVLSNSFFNSAFFGSNYQPANDLGVFDLFSFGVKGSPATTIRVTKHLVSNPADPGKFNLRIDGTTYAANVGDGGTTGDVVVSPGTHTISETAGSFTFLGNYTARIECSDGSAGYGTSLSGVNAPFATSVFCTITNTRKLFKT